MSEQRSAALVFGSVQLGLAYGIANRTGKPSREAALRLVRRACEAGVAQFDTARAYGDSEERLGEALLDATGIRAITKLSPMSELPPGATRLQARAAVDASIAHSLKALRRERLDCVLLHRAAHLNAFGGAIWERLIERLEDGTVAALGVSVQSPEEARAALAEAHVAHIQLPFNLLDWRWRASGIVACLRARQEIAVHARSVFLQGLLAADDASLWPHIEGVDAKATVALLAELCCELGRESPADLCLAYAHGQDWIDGVVVGVESQNQLDENLRLFARPPLSRADCEMLEERLPRLPEALLDPAQWPR
jgi:spore coat polysaccharide biosynthesis protein SpsF